jgi:hypothetical protein
MSAGGTSLCRGFIFLSLHLSVSLGRDRLADADEAPGDGVVGLGPGD